MEISTQIDIIKNVKNNKSFSKTEVLEILNTITKLNNHNNKPKYLKKGDVINNLIGNKVRPCVIIKVEKEQVYVIPMSTTDDHNKLCDAKSRFFKDGYFTKTLASINYDIAIKQYKGSYDNPKHLNIVIKQLKVKLNEILN